MTQLDYLAREYVDLHLLKNAYDPIDVYFLADRPFWKRDSLEFSHTEKFAPGVPVREIRVRSLEELRNEACDLLSDLEKFRKTATGNERVRTEYIIEHTAAVIMRTRILLGEKVTYDEMTRECYGLVAPQQEYAVFDEILKDMEEVLPHPELPLTERIEEFKRKTTLPESGLKAAMDFAIRFFHSSAVTNMGIRSDNMPRLRYKKLGGKKEFTQILFGYDYDKFDWERITALDYPYDIETLISVASHETEPGHLTFFSLRAKAMVDHCYPELGLNPQYSPSGAFIEGAARAAIWMTLDEEEKYLDFAREIIKRSGMDMGIIDCLPVWDKFKKLSGYAKLEAERNVWNGTWSKEEAVSFLKKYGFFASSAGTEQFDHMAEDDGHFTSHDYSRDVVEAYFNSKCTMTQEKWQLYTNLCQIPVSMRRIADGSFDPSCFDMYM